MEKWHNIYLLSLFLLHYFDILEAKNISCIIHGNRVHEPCVSGLVQLFVDQYLKTGPMRIINETKEARDSVKDLLASYRSLETLRYPGEDVTVKHLR